MTNTLHKNLTAGELHYSKIFVSGLVPTTIPTYNGETYYNSTSNIFYIAIGTSSAADWQPVITGASVNSQSGLTYTVVASDNGKIIDMTSSGVRTVTLPSNPVNGFQVGVFDGSGNAYTNDITIEAVGGRAFWNGDATYKIVSNYAGITLTFDESSNKWITTAEAIGGTLVIDSLLDTVTIDNDIDHTKQLQFSLLGATTGTKTTINVSQTADRTLTLPNVTDTLVGLAATQTLSNKTVTGLTNQTNPIVMQGATSLRFNNAGNTFYSSIQAGNNASNLGWTLPITAPTAGSMLSSTDTNGTLAWSTLPTSSQQSVATATNINALSNTTSTVILTGATATNLNGITAGASGQQITIFNGSSALITVTDRSGSASAANQIHIPSNSTTNSLYILPLYSLTFIYNSIIQNWVPLSQISSLNILGTPPSSTSASVPNGAINELFSVHGTSPISIAGPSVNTTKFLTSSLDKGIWDVGVNINFTFFASSISVGDIFTAIMGISQDSSATTYTDYDPPVNGISLSWQNYSGTVFSIGDSVCIPKWRLAITSNSTPLFLKAGFTATVGPTYDFEIQNYYLFATRVG